MPASKRTTRRPRIGATLSEDIRTLLETGFTMYWRIENRQLNREPTADEIQRLWALHGGTVTAEWVEKCPGSRPWAWWQFDAPERRRCINGVHPHDRADRDAYIAETDKQFPGFAASAMRLYFGMPSTGIPEFRDEDLEYESEPDYLTRLGLWEPDERERWERMPKEDCDTISQ